MTGRLHDSLIVIDGMQVGGDWPRPQIEELRAGGATCIVTTNVVWEDAKGALDDIGKWRRRFAANADLILPVHTGADILRAKEENKTGIIYGFQNASPFEDSIDYVGIFHTLGVRVVQLTYNNQNHIASGCYEEHDGGISRFGKLVIREMNALGMVVDLSHVGERSSLEAIDISSRPVAITHGNPSFLKEHKRNKSGTVLKALAAKGGVLGCSPYPNLTGEITLQQWCEMVARVADMIGVEHVGIGTDLARGWGDVAGHVTWGRMGRWTREVDYGASAPGSAWGYATFPDWFTDTSDLPKLTQGLLDVGFSEKETGLIVGGNWLRFYTEAFQPEGAPATAGVA